MFFSKRLLTSFWLAIAGMLFLEGGSSLGAAQVKAGANVTLSVSANGTAPFSYQWKKDGVQISGANAASLAITNFNVSSAGSYSAVVSNSAGSTTSAAVALAILSDPGVPVMAAQPLSSALFAGGSVTLTGGATSTLALSYQWQKNGVDIPGATSASLNLNNVTVASAGNYALVARTSAGAVISSFARVVVLVPQPNAITYGATVYPSAVTVGGTVGLDYALTNIGTRNWTANHFLTVRDNKGAFLAFSSLGGAKSGENKSAHVEFTAPTVPGVYTYYVQAMESGVEFFSNQATFTLTVLAAKPNSISYNRTSLPAIAAPGTIVNFDYSVTNTGSKAWGANHFLSLRNGSGVYSIFAAISGVGPGQSKTVNLSLTAPTTPGVYYYYVQAMESGVEFFNSQANLVLTVVAPQPNAVVYTATRSPESVMPGATVNLKYSLTNVGTATWGADHYASLRDGNGNFLAFVPVSGVAPLASVTVNFSFVAPSAPGAYTYYVQALDSGVEFFDTQDQVDLTVGPGVIANGVTYNASTFPDSAARGSTVTFTQNVTNRGTKAWGANHYLSLRDADGVSLYFAPLNGTAVGASKAVTCTFVAPSAPGTYTYRVQALESGVEHFSMADTFVLTVP